MALLTAFVLYDSLITSLIVLFFVIIIRMSADVALLNDT
jgi:hypothetical protein